MLTFPLTHGMEVTLLFSVKLAHDLPLKIGGDTFIKPRREAKS